MDYPTYQTYQDLFRQQYGGGQQYAVPPTYTGQIIQVNGKAGAEALKMAPNSSIFVQDATNGNRIFLCMTDGAGYKTVKGIICTFEEEQERKQQESIILSLEERIKVLEGIVSEYITNHASVSSGGATSQSD